MKTLAMETSTAMGSIALVEDGNIVEEVRAVMRGRHSMRLLSETDRILSYHNLTIQDIDLFVASRGPGSFTGLRVGLATIKGLAFATNRPAVGVSSLKTLAWPLRHVPCVIAAVLDARKHEIYAALYKGDGASGLEMLLEEDVAPAERWAVSVKSMIRDKEDILLVGDGALLYSEVLRKILGPRVHLADAELAHPRASAMASLGRIAFEAGEVSDPVLLDAEYIRPSEAELNQRKKSLTSSRRTAAREPLQATTHEFYQARRPDR